MYSECSIHQYHIHWYNINSAYSDNLSKYLTLSFNNSPFICRNDLHWSRELSVLCLGSSKTWLNNQPESSVFLFGIPKTKQTMAFEIYNTSKSWMLITYSEMLLRHTVGSVFFFGSTWVNISQHFSFSIQGINKALNQRSVIWYPHGFA